MPTWKSKICRGMDVVESITFVRKETIDGVEKTSSAVYVPAANNLKSRAEWTQEEIDAIGETLIADLDKSLT
jgi:3-oxoacyl-[acyl-carrier-protein] synthase III